MATVPPVTAKLTAKQRLFARPLVHRLYPANVGIRLARRRADRWWDSYPTVRSRARLQMEFTAGALDAAEMDSLARSYVFETLKREEYLWRAWRATRMPVAGAEVLRDANAHSGVILSFIHHGQHTGIFGAIGRRGFDLHVAVYPSFLKPWSPTYAGIRGRQLLKTIQAHGATVFSALGSYAAIRDLLRDGRIVAIAADVPGRAVTEFLGRRVGVESGTARLACETGAVIVPVAACRDGSFQRLTIGAPIDPASCDQAEVQRAVFSAQEQAIRSWPEAFERPRRRLNPVTPADVARFGPRSEFSSSLL